MVSIYTIHRSHMNHIWITYDSHWSCVFWYISNLQNQPGFGVTGLRYVAHLGGATGFQTHGSDPPLPSMEGHGGWKQTGIDLDLPWDVFPGLRAGMLVVVSQPNPCWKNSRQQSKLDHETLQKIFWGWHHKEFSWSGCVFFFRKTKKQHTICIGCRIRGWFEVWGWFCWDVEMVCKQKWWKHPKGSFMNVTDINISILFQLLY